MNRKVEERLYAETDGSCALCGVRDARVLTVHHIEHERLERDDSYDNLIVICHNCHTSYHQGKGAKISDIKTIKKRLIQKTLTQFGVNALKVAKRSSLVSGAPYILNHLVEMGYLEFHELLMGTDDRPDIAEYRATEKGLTLLKKWRF